MRDVILFGKPGAGKDTLAKHLVEKYGYIEINMGRMLREMADKGDPHGVMLKEKYWAAGNLVPDHESNTLARNYIDGLLKNKPLVLNGWPRNNGQVDYYFTFLAAVDMDAHWDLPIKREYCVEIINVNVPDEIAIQRLMKRGRVDDTEEIVKNRMVVYENETKDCVSYIKRAYALAAIEFDGSGTIEKMNKRFDDQLLCEIMR